MPMERQAIWKGNNPHWDEIDNIFGSLGFYPPKLGHGNPRQTRHANRFEFQDCNAFDASAIRPKTHG